jgi:hypothetical protein
VRLNIDIPESDLPAISAAVRRQRPLKLELAAAGEASVSLPNLGYNHHDGVWQYVATLNLSDALFQRLARTGALSITGPSGSHVYAADRIGDSMPAFVAACKPR